MKNKLLLLTYILINISCSAQKRFIKTNQTCLFDDPIFQIKKEEMVFDNEKYDSILSLKGVIIKDIDNFIYEIQPNTLGITDKKSKLTKWVNYHDSNKIESVSFFIRNSTSTNIGKEYLFNEKGQIIETIDYEKGYNICWAEAISILKKIAKKDIKKYDINTFYLSRVDLNEFPNKKPKWRISMDGNEEYSDLDRKIYEIDGVTGEFIRAYEIETIYDD
ncbi:hypothetical protein [Aquimarina sp. I32.4]|uniref:hypothetical protein n=1 Tax=Aquimarina sp. I32.4 TaxID=2053903 RepID=UPI000CDEBDEA|nr:hypothetical protein [Aquimarina sp. I32.4]